MGDVKPPTSDSDVSNNSKRQLEKFTQENPTFGSILVHPEIPCFFPDGVSMGFMYTLPNTNMDTQKTMVLEKSGLL